MQQLFVLFEGRFHVLQGGAFGADNRAWFAAKKLNIDVATILPEWAKHGKRAGIFRNIQMLDRRPQYVVALWDGKSKGTLHTIDKAVNVYRIPTLVFKS